MVPNVSRERECLMELLLRLRLLLLQLVSIGPPKEKEYFCKKSNSRKLAFKREILLGGFEIRNMFKKSREQASYFEKFKNPCQKKQFGQIVGLGRT
jgi:hypothetical protein